MKFFSRWFGKKTKNSAPKTAKVSTEEQFTEDFKAFILEPILTPSALFDFGGDDTPDLPDLDGNDPPTCPT